MKKMKQKVKKKLLIKLFPVIAVLFTILMGSYILVSAIAGNAFDFGAPAEETTAAKYKSICTQLSVPWDIVMLTDTELAEKKGTDGIEDCNIFDTALEFCVLQEKEFTVTQESSTNEAGEEIIVENKTLAKTTNYNGKSSILEYIGCTELGSLDASTIISKTQEKATSKSSESVSYEVTFKGTDNIEKILSSIFGFTDDEIQDIIDIHDGNYLASIYGDDTGTIVIGNVSIGEYSDIEDAVHQFLIDIGFNEIGSAATMGNMAVESSFVTTANHSGIYFGLCQWGGGRWNGNQIALLSFSQLQGTEWYDLQTQLNFFRQECSSSYQDTFQQMVNATDLIFATDYFCAKYEICEGTLGNWAISLVDGKAYQALSDRRIKAQLYYNKYANVD